MRKVIVIGCPGSGKSTFSRSLHGITDIPLFHLDMMNHNADKTTVSKEIFRKRISEVMKNDSWIIDGNYGSTIEMRMKECDTVFFLDYPVEICLTGVRERRGKICPDMPWIEEEEDPEFIEFIKNFALIKRPEILKLLEQYFEKNIITFNSREESDEYLSELDKSIWGADPHPT